MCVCVDWCACVAFGWVFSVFRVSPGRGCAGGEEQWTRATARFSVRLAVGAREPERTCWDCHSGKNAGTINCAARPRTPSMDERADSGPGPEPGHLCCRANSGADEPLNLGTITKSERPVCETSRYETLLDNAVDGPQAQAQARGNRCVVPVVPPCRLAQPETRVTREQSALASRPRACGVRPSLSDCPSARALRRPAVVALPGLTALSRTSQSWRRGAPQRPWGERARPMPALAPPQRARVDRRGSRCGRARHRTHAQVLQSP